MPLAPPTARRIAPLLVAAATLGLAGCAGLPRIDPSGERFLIFPERANTPPPLSAPSGNVTAPPVVGSGASSFTLCPFCPGGGCGSLGSCCPLGSLPDLFASNPVPPPGPAFATPPVAARSARPAFPDADETLAITPERLLAPVGSEVVLKAGVCARDGYLRTNRRIEWTLGGEGAGQFVNIGERGELDVFRYPWQYPAKIDNTYAVGYAAPFHVCLRRGTADPSDDTQVRPGEAWITVTSASEGASYVTAYAPESSHWEARRASATIYWVDARWQLPPDANVQPGSSHTLTTVVTRESDGAPVAGYVVRYEALGGAAAQLGYEGGRVTEVTTDANGRASVEISPTDDQPGTAQVGVTVIRPPQSAPMASPRLELGSGQTVVTWSPTATPTPFLPADPSTPLPSDPNPPSPFQPAPSTPIPSPPTSSAAPRLEVTVRRDSAGPIQVNDTIPVTITVLNAGDAPATGVELRDAFDRGLTNAGDIAGDYEIKYPGMRDLSPGESQAIPLEFTAIAPGRQCHRVTVSAVGAEPAFEQQCFEIQAPAPPPEADVRITAEGELQRSVGQQYTFRARVTNRGAAPAEGYTLEIVHESDRVLLPQLATEGNFAVERGLGWTLPTLAPGESRRFEIKYDCLAEDPEASVSAWLLKAGAEILVETRAVEIVGAAGPSGPPIPPPTASPLRGSISSAANPAQVGRPAALDVAIANDGAQTLRDVEFRLVFRGPLRPTLAPGASTIPFRVNQNTLQFDVIPELRPGEPVRLVIPYEPLSQGQAEVLLEMLSPDVDGVQSAVAPITIRSR